MGSVFYVMAILGCGDAGAQCQQVSVEQAHYQSVESCTAATAAVLMRNNSADYPVLKAQCRQAGQPMSAQIGIGGAG